MRTGGKNSVLEDQEDSHDFGQIRAVALVAKRDKYDRKTLASSYELTQYD